MPKLEDFNNKDIYYWAITIFHKTINNELKYLVVENNETKNISFVSGAKEETDSSLTETAKREIKEELNIDINEMELIETNTQHEFVFWENKKKRAWKKAIYKVFVSDWKNIEDIQYTKELRSAVWMTKEEVLKTLSFDDLKDVFKKAIWEIK